MSCLPTTFSCTFSCPFYRRAWLNKCSWNDPTALDINDMPQWHVCCMSDAEKVGFKKNELSFCGILVLQKSCKDTTQSSHTLYPVDTSHCHGTFVNTKKLMSVCHYELNSRLYLDFTRFSINVLFPIRDLIQDTTSHSVVMSPQPLVTISQSFPVFRVLNSLGKHWPGIL